MMVSARRMSGARIATHADGRGEGLTARDGDVCVRRVYILRVFNRLSALVLSVAS